MNEKIARFLDDKAMNQAVYDVLFNCFLKDAKGDVQTLAAQRIALSLLQEAWRELERYRPTKPKQDAQPNPGL